MENESELEIATRFNGAPYYIYDRWEGKFKIVDALTKNSKKEVFYHFSDEVLQLGIDIKETSNRNLQLVVEISEHDTPEQYNKGYIDECRKLAIISGHDYVSTETFGNGVTWRLLCKKGDIGYYLIRPRLFRKIHND